MKIKNKIMLAVLIILLISGMTVTVIWYSSSRKMSDTYLKDVSESTMKYAYSAFEYLLTDTEYMATLIATNETNIIDPAETLNKKKDSLMQNRQWTREYLDSKRLIEEYITGMYGYKYYIAGIAVAVNPDCIFSAGPISAETEGLYEEMLALDEDALRYSVCMMDPIHLEGLKATLSSDYVVPAVRGIVGVGGEIVGYVVLYFDYGVIDQMFSVNLPEGSCFKVRNAQGAEIFSNQEEYSGQADSNDYVESTFLAKDIGWEFHMSIPVQIYTQGINGTALLTGAVIVIVILAAGLISVFIVSKMTREITVLKEKMTAMSNGDMTVRYEVKAEDEIGEMGHTFNHMVVRIRRLMERVAEEEQQKRANEMAFLQAQINPHFISNVLNNVVWMARMQHADNLIPLVNSLNILLYSAMHQEKDMIPLRDELKYVDNYITIVEYSGSYDFRVERRIEPETETMLIPRFILQPIVENAIYHGLDNSLSVQGCITICSKLEKGLLYIIIEDNGKGMDEEQIAKIMTEKKAREHSFNGIGIRNVNERIKLFLGPEYGLEYESVPGEYTRCIFRLPIVEDKDE
ncbi:MAG TPA: sensor histidine kinase [Candidatus Mediterraneibacter faecipullorum]|uniref:histidine kinase n=1 Tax=Candidatus Mediterraneibacter faecipullorum TaxID=2838670 RepID=A0A9D2NN99_9FIRM|nr:sensor histidine kinase [Candidatus Mediterraneibacter faecipullorum]